MTDVPRDPGSVTGPWLARQLGTSASTTTIDEVTRIGASHGFSATVLRVRGWAGTSPVDLALKLGGADGVAREAWALAGLGEQGVRGVPRLRFVVLDEDRGVGALATDHVRGEQGDVLHGAPADDLGALLPVLAAFHARGVRRGHELPTRPRTGRRRMRLRPERLASFVAHHRDALDPAVGRWLDGLAAAVEAADRDLAAGPATVVHGDVHLDNVLHTSHGPVLLDWEGVRPGTPAEDLAPLVVARTTDGVEELGPTSVTAVVAAYAREVAALGHPVDPGLRRRVRSALVVHAAGLVNWAGRMVGERPPGARLRAVVEAVPDDVGRIAAVVGDPGPSCDGPQAVAEAGVQGGTEREREQREGARHDGGPVAPGPSADVP